MSKKVILLIDDERIILNSLIEQLSAMLPDDILYETAETADEGLEFIEEMVASQHDVLVMVCDWLMPGMKGDELLIEVHKKYPGIVKIMLTGQADQAAIARAKKHANLHSCVAKPWSEKTLVQTIKEGLVRIDPH